MASTPCSAPVSRPIGPARSATIRARYSRRMPTVSSVPSLPGTTPGGAGSRWPCTSRSGPATVAGSRFIGVEPMKLATNVLAGPHQWRDPACCPRQVSHRRELPRMGRPTLNPVVWTPPAAPARARATTGTRPLPPVRRIELPRTGPEEGLVDADGQVLTGLADGRILRITPDGRLIETVADTGGRPLGLELLPDGAVLVCDARRGLLRVDSAGGAVEPLAGGF